MAQRPRCLLIAPVMPSPTGSGLQQRAFQILSQLTQRFETTVLVVCETEAVSDLNPAIPVATLRVKTSMGLGKRLAQWIPPLVLLHPSWAADWPDMDSNYVLSLANDGPIALCFVFRLRMHGIAEVLRKSLKPLKTVLDLDDVESLTLASIGWFAVRRGRARLALTSFSKALQSFFLERLLVEHYDCVSLSNPDDLELMRSIAGSTEVKYLPNRAPSAPVAVLAQTLPPISTLLFIGSLNYFPNEDAALWIVESVLVALRSRVKTRFRIRIAGRHASPRVRARMQGIPEVEFLGEVPLVQSLYAEAQIALVLVRCGGGTKIKALEAAAFRCPIVGTSHAMRGLGLKEGRDYLCGDTAEDIAACCAFLLEQPDRGQAMARNAYERLTSLSTVEWEMEELSNFPS
jgi:glycosyltransferase involved in cell wall biosynthesis